MKKAFLAACALILASMPAMAAPAIGEAAPAFSVKDVNGKEQSLEQYKGKIVVLEWTNPGCPFVRKHYDSGNMQTLQQYAVGKEVVWLTVNSGAEGREGHQTAETAKEQLKKDGAHETAYLLDPEGTLGHSYGAKATPHMFVIDAEGKLAYEGAIDSVPSADKADIKEAKNYVREAIDALAGGKAVETKQTRAYGCSVKYKN